MFKTVLNKSLIAAATVAAIGTMGGSASAATYPVFQFNPTVFSTMAECGNPFAVSCTPQFADRISGNYYENLTLNLGLGTFSATGYAKFVFINDATDTNIPASASGLTNTYNLYAPFTASGTITPISGGGFTFNPTAATGDLYVDDNLNTVFDTDPTGGYAIPNPAAQADDKLLISGLFFGGSGLTNSSTGSYVLNYNPLHLTDTGTSCSVDGVSAGPGPGCTFFTFPRPFFALASLSGQLINPADGPNQVNGTADLIFGNNPVPEPATLALFGLGLVGVAAGRRRLSSKK
jgi:hypothetical protein